MSEKEEYKDLLEGQGGSNMQNLERYKLSPEGQPTEQPIPNFGSTVKQFFDHSISNFGTILK